jgi:hypothetical protein
VDLNPYQPFERRSSEVAEIKRVKWPEASPRLRRFGRVVDTRLAVKNRLIVEEDCSSRCPNGEEILAEQSIRDRGSHERGLG